MNKFDFEKLIKKDISMETFTIYKKLYIAYKEILPESASLENFIKIINIKQIPQDVELKKKRQEAKKLIPKIESEIADLNISMNKLESTTNLMKDSGAKNINSYLDEKIKLQRKIKVLDKQLIKIKNSIK